MSTSTVDPTLNLSPLIHLVTIKLNSSNYLQWNTQIYPLLCSHDLFQFLDGRKSAPSLTTTDSAGNNIPNSSFTEWKAQDQRLRTFLQATLTEESMTEVIGCTTSKDVWDSLVQAYSDSSKARELCLKDELQLIKKGSRSVGEYGRQFKSLYDQLSAIGCPVGEADKSHWFLRGLGASFASFSAAQMTLKPLPNFRDLQAQAESFDLFQKSLEDTPSPQAAFISQAGHSTAFQPHRGRGRGGHSNGRGRGRRTPRCQICRLEGHYADACPKRYGSPTTPAANLVEAYNASGSRSQPSASNWFLDTGASAHMTPSTSSLSLIPVMIVLSLVMVISYLFLILDPEI